MTYEKFVTCSQCSYENFILVPAGIAAHVHLDRGFTPCANCGGTLGMEEAS